MDIAHKIIAIREKYNLTQKELGQIAGVSGAAVSTWELGEKQPKIKPLQKICAHFGLSINDLVSDNTITLSKEKTSANTVRIAGRDGSYTEKRLTDEQVKALRLILDQMPEAEDL